MIFSTLHTVRHTFRRAIAAGMVALYLTLVISPLAASAIQGSGAAGASVHECAGDCNTCGCPPESRAAETCCCAKKRQQQTHLHEDDNKDVPDCCKNEREDGQETVISCGCPCGTNSHEEAFLRDRIETLPYHFYPCFSVAMTETGYPVNSNMMTTRHTEPPTPPPKLSAIA